MLTLSPQGGPKTKVAVFYLKNGLFSKKVCYINSCVKIFRDKVVRYSLAYAQMVGGGRPLLPKIFGKNDPSPAKTMTSIAPQP